QPYSPINPTNLDMDFEDLMFSQEYNYSQDYSMGHGSGHGLGHGSSHGSAHSSVPFHDDEDDSPIEEVSPVKPKKPSRRAAKAKKDETKEVKEPPKEWTMEEEIALCQGWCDVSENNISRNSIKAKGFWEVVIRYFEKETGSTRGYDSIVSKWKNRVRPKIGAFCAIIKNIEANHESGTNDLDVYQKACWTDVEMPHFFKIQRRKMSKTSETTSESASGGINLNEEADEAVQDTQEFRPMGRNQEKAKKKAAGSSSLIVDLVADNFYNMKHKNREKKDKEQQAYMEMKNQELNIREADAREIAQLKREKLEIQRRMLELAEREKRDRDILFYNSIIDTNLPPVKQHKLLEMKMEIKERYNLDY
ncbi:hypothetical protein Tco_1181438, partial [Tanacetum coccineum]